MWRGDNNGGSGSDCSAQCAPGEINIQGIGSSWGGGFLNDGDTNKCGRGYKVRLSNGFDRLLLIKRINRCSAAQALITTRQLKGASTSDGESPLRICGWH